MRSEEQGTTLSHWQIKQRQELPLDVKIKMSIEKIEEWYDHWKGEVYVAFSGGKDSTVLLDLVRKVRPDVMGVFSDTGLEYPEIRNFVKTKENITWVRPKMNFRKVLSEVGYPIISKEISGYIDSWRRTSNLNTKDKLWNGSKFGLFKISGKWRYLIYSPFKISSKCCDIMKKDPIYVFNKETGINAAYVGIMAGESRQRLQNYARQGCNAFDNEHPKSIPIAFWREKDVWDYIKKYDLPYCNIYDDRTTPDGQFVNGETRTGCMFCMYGLHFENKEKGSNRFERMKISHPKQYKYCMEKLGMGEVINWYLGEGEHSTSRAYCDSNS